MLNSLPYPKSVAQLTGMIVTAIVVFGTDMDVTYAMPLGVFAGGLAMFFVFLSEGRTAHEKRWMPQREMSRARWERFR